MVYYIALMSRTHALILDTRLKNENIICELTFMPREIMFDLCNMGVKFTENELQKVVPILKKSGLPGCRLFKEFRSSYGCTYEEILI